MERGDFGMATGALREDRCRGGGRLRALDGGGFTVHGARVQGNEEEEGRWEAAALERRREEP